MIWSNSFDNAIAISASKTFEALPSVFKEIIISLIINLLKNNNE